ncbi:hypothetical protein ACWGS5_30395, partial [Streptomyces albidoflavus]
MLGFYEYGITVGAEEGEVRSPPAVRFAEQLVRRTQDAVERAGRGGAVTVCLAGQEVGGPDGENGLDLFGGHGVHQVSEPGRDLLGSATAGGDGCGPEGVLRGRGARAAGGAGGAGGA